MLSLFVSATEVSRFLDTAILGAYCISSVSIVCVMYKCIMYKYMDGWNTRKLITEPDFEFGQEF